ncbi:hypothetical protein CYMTET_45483 [Cymbomonas tetramitiformis]|uniref:Uncharacterized protein n=1 Tax=Cymbomonas tetramitiformis TaxID=36881 RepID=A0AAE0C079_9CHLO|nr:hypothetical protein CYMTET_45483 [Cymbomonas tetramitiformis]
MGMCARTTWYLSEPVQVYGGLGPGRAYGFLRKTQRRFRERRYMAENVGEGELVDGNGAEDGDEEAVRGSTVGWKEKWIRLLFFVLAACEDAVEETDFATQDPHGGGMRKSGGTQREQSGQEAEHLRIAGGEGEGTAEAQSAGAGGQNQAASSVQDILAERDDLSSPGPESGVWTQKQSGAAPEQVEASEGSGVVLSAGLVVKRWVDRAARGAKRICGWWGGEGEGTTEA